MSSQANYAYDTFVALLQQEEARESLLKLVRDPKFRGLSVAARPSASVSQSSTIDPNPGPATAASTPLAQFPSNENPAPLSQVPGATDLAAVDVPRDDDSLPETTPPGSPTEADDSDSSNDLMFDDLQETWVPKYKKDHPLIPLDKAFDGSTLQLRDAIKYEEHKIRKEERDRKKLEHGEPNENLDPASLPKDEQNERKRKDMDGLEEDAKESSQPLKKKRKQVSFAETLTEVRTIPEEEVTVMEDSDQWQAYRSTDISRKDLYGYSGDEQEAAEGLVQLSWETTQDVPESSPTPFGPVYGEPSSPQAPQQPWQPPPEVEGLSLSGRLPVTDVRPSQRRLVGVAPPRIGPYVFAGVRTEYPLKRRAEGEPGAARPIKMRKTRQLKDQVTAEPVRRSRRLQEKAEKPETQPTPDPLVAVQKKPGRLLVKMKVGSANLSRLMRY